MGRFVYEFIMYSVLNRKCLIHSHISFVYTTKDGGTKSHVSRRYAPKAFFAY